MAVWDLDVPGDGVQYNTITTYIQALKTDIVERMRCTNADGVDEHSAYGATVTGRHAISQVGFVKTHTTSGAMATFDATYFPGDGTLHYVEDISTLYVKHDDATVVLTTLDHGALAGLTTLADHTQYLATDGSRTMLGGITLSGLLVATALGEEDSDPLSADHATESWHDAHGDNAIATTHFADSTQISLTTTHTYKNHDSDRYGYSFLGEAYTFDLVLTGYELSPCARQTGTDLRIGNLGFKFTIGVGTQPWIIASTETLGTTGLTRYDLVLVGEESVAV